MISSNGQICWFNCCLNFNVRVTMTGVNLQVLRKRRLRAIDLRHAYISNGSRPSHCYSIRTSPLTAYAGFSTREVYNRTKLADSRFPIINKPHNRWLTADER